MMINPSSSDSTTVFALLTAIASPEAAKASLQEIVDASTALQERIDAFRQEVELERSDISKQKFEVQADLDQITQTKDELKGSLATAEKKLSELSDNLDLRQSSIDALEANQSAKEAELISREKLVSTAEASVSAREDAAQQLMDEATALQADYSSKISALKGIVS